MEIDIMFLKEVVEVCQTKMAAPIVFAPDRNGSLRFWVDSQKSSAVSKQDEYPIPQINSFVKLLDKAAGFSTLDVNSSYWQVEI